MFFPAFCPYFPNTIFHNQYLINTFLRSISSQLVENLIDGKLAKTREKLVKWIDWKNMNLIDIHRLRGAFEGSNGCPGNCLRFLLRDVYSSQVLFFSIIKIFPLHEWNLGNIMNFPISNTRKSSCFKTTLLGSKVLACYFSPN